MPQNSLLPSVLGNVAAQRQRLSAARQMLGLESAPGRDGMRPIAPINPEGPANVPGAAKQAVQQQPDYSNFTLPPEQETAMLQQISDHLHKRDAAAAQPQQAQAPAPAPAPQQAPQQAPQAPAPAPQSAQDQQALQGALGPFAQFFKENGRMPNVEDLKSMMAARQLEEQLGRKPTDTEIQLYRSKPPKTG